MSDDIETPDEFPALTVVEDTAAEEVPGSKMALLLPAAAAAIVAGTAWAVTRFRRSKSEDHPTTLDTPIETTATPTE